MVTEEKINSSDSPKVTVIILAYNRKNFILEALKSVLNQEVKASLYEVIVVKNYNDEYIDNKIRENGATLINSSNRSLGGKIIEGFALSKGDIVCFLEDDDLFTQNKIKHVIDVFSNYDVEYYHNSVLVIDEQGIEWEPNVNIKRDNQRINELGTAYIHPGKSKTEVGNFPGVNFNYNLSSISVNRKLMEDNIEVIGNTEHGLDWLLHLIALQADKGLLTDSSKLTNFRIHSANSSFNGSSDAVLYLSDVVESLEMRQRSLYTMVKISRKIGIKREILNKARAYYVHGILLNILGSGKRTKSIELLVHYLRYAIFSRKNFRSDLVIYCLISIFSLNRAKSIYLRRHSIATI